jgi:hypothetical protein
LDIDARIAAAAGAILVQMPPINTSSQQRIALKVHHLAVSVETRM